MTAEMVLEPHRTLPWEPPQARALEWLPPAVRYKLDCCALRISLAQWQALTLQQRTSLLEAPLQADAGSEPFATRLQQWIAEAHPSDAGAPPSFADYLERKLARAT